MITLPVLNPLGDKEAAGDRKLPAAAINCISDIIASRDPWSHETPHHLLICQFSSIDLEQILWSLLLDRSAVL